VELSDEKELESIRAGDETAFEVVFKRYYQTLCNYAYTYLPDREEAEEVVQSAFLVLWERRGSGIHSSVKAYLFSMVRNSSLNAIKHKKVRQKHAEEQLATHPGAAESVAHTVISNELEERIAKALQKLPEQCRLIFKMNRFEELKYAEIASELNISVKTVENQIGKALKIMRDQLRDYLTTFLIMMSSLFL
jgi:RNA polymerase sigma-70 factor (ECF subfamily)